jgi:hypothetical protein
MPKLKRYQQEAFYEMFTLAAYDKIIGSYIIIYDEVALYITYTPERDFY